jgi:hypothetical protein
MSINTEPTFISVRKRWGVDLTSQVFARGGQTITPTAPALLGTAGDYGALIHEIMVAPTGTVVANNIRFFVLPAGGSQLQRSIDWALPAFTDSSQSAIAPYYLLSTQANVANSNKPFPQLLILTDGRGIPLAPNESLYVALGVAETTSRIHVSVFVGDYAAAS